jgi:hypothetical protein
MMTPDMNKVRWTACVRRVAFGSALGLVVLAAVAPGTARAQDDDEKTSFWNFDKKLMHGFMKGLGLRDGSESQIEYRERSPLVIPPSADLPSPQQAGGGQTPAWPTDPDVKRRKEAREKNRNYRGDDPERSARNLTPSELNPPGSTGGSGGAGSPASLGDDGRPVAPSALGYVGGLFSSFGGQKDESATFQSEPPRSSLTAPPTGYQTPSPAQPYGITSKKDKKLTVTPYDRPSGTYGN